jgi:hypothetical protein
MEGYIKYKRICTKTKEDDIQQILDDLVTEGWDIISYNEKVISQEPYESYIIMLTILAGKRQNRTL